MIPRTISRYLPSESESIFESGFNPFERTCNFCGSKTYSPLLIGKRTCENCRKYT